MQLPYAHVIFSTCDVAVIHTWAPCLYLKMMWHTTWVFGRILNKWPNCRGHAKCNHMQICSRDLCLSHLILWVASSPNYYECVVLPYTQPTRASVSLQHASLLTWGPSIVCVHTHHHIVCVRTHHHKWDVSLRLYTHNMHEVPLILILTSLLTQP